MEKNMKEVSNLSVATVACLLMVLDKAITGVVPEGITDGAKEEAFISALATQPIVKGTN
jgi:hypothetical protein